MKGTCPRAHNQTNPGTHQTLCQLLLSRTNHSGTEKPPQKTFLFHPNQHLPQRCGHRQLVGALSCCHSSSGGRGTGAHLRPPNPPWAARRAPPRRTSLRAAQPLLGALSSRGTQQTSRRSDGRRGCGLGRRPAAPPLALHAASSPLCALPEKIKTNQKATTMGTRQQKAARQGLHRATKPSQTPSVCCLPSQRPPGCCWR